MATLTQTRVNATSGVVHITTLDTAPAGSVDGTIDLSFNGGQLTGSFTAPNFVPVDRTEGCQ
jgi:hypothetical protein